MGLDRGACGGPLFPAIQEASGRTPDTQGSWALWLGWMLKDLACLVASHGAIQSLRLLQTRNGAERRKFPREINSGCCFAFGSSPRAAHQALLQLLQQHAGKFFLLRFHAFPAISQGRETPQVQISGL